MVKSVKNLNYQVFYERVAIGKLIFNIDQISIKSNF